MKVIRIALVNFWNGFEFERTLFYRLLSAKFKIVVGDESPDFVLASVFGDVSRVLRYKCPRILYTAETVLPDFTLFDYAIGWNNMMVPDASGHNRYFRFPISFIEWHSDYGEIMQSPLSLFEARQILKEKQRFCCFTSGHDSVGNTRSKLLSFFSEYKRIDSLGTWANNMGDGVPVCYYGPGKIDVLKPYKFSLVVESFQYPGFVTEKLFDALCSHTIPIYLGDPCVQEIYNSSAFINIGNYKSLDEVIGVIKHLDEDDEEYVKMLCEPVYSTPQYFTRLLDDYYSFLLSIFDQDFEEAYRRPLFYTASEWENRLVSKWPTRIPIRTKIYRKLALAWWHVRHTAAKRRHKS